MINKYILALDPSNKHTAYCLIELPSLKPVEFGFLYEEEMLDYVENCVCSYEPREVYLAVEGIQSLGMLVGQSVFDTCVLIGRLLERARLVPWLDSIDFELGRGYEDIRVIYRKQEKMNLCGTMTAKDANITQALVDRFAPNTPNKGKGSKANKGWFYGFSKDIWQAYAIGVTYYDLYYSKDFNEEGA